MRKALTQQVCIPTAHGLRQSDGHSSVLEAIFKGSAGALLVNGLGVATAFGAHCVLARALGAAKYGTFAVVLSWVSLCVLVAKFGLDLTMVRFVAQYRVQRQWSKLRGIVRFSYFVAAALGLAVSVAFAATVTVIGDRIAKDISATLMIGAVAIPLLAIAWVNQAGLRGLKRVVRCHVPMAILRPWLLAGAVAAVCYRFGLQCSAATAMSINVLAILAAVVLGAVWLRRSMPVKIRSVPTVYEVGNWLRTSLPLFLTTAMRVLVMEIDIILIGLILGPVSAGIYGVASRCTRLISFGLLAGNAIAGPMISELHSLDRHHDLQQATRLACRIATLIALLIAGILFAARWPILGLFGPQFQNGALVLAILSVGQIVNACTGPVGTLLNMTGNQIANARILVVITVLNLTCSYPAIRIWGIEGAAIVTSSLIALKNIWTWFVVRNRLGINSSVLSLRRNRDNLE